MDKRRVFSYVSLFLAEVVAVLYDTQFLHQLQQQAARYFSTALLFTYMFGPLLIIGILLAVGLSFINYSRSIWLFVGFAVFNIASFLANIFLGVKYTPLMFYDFRGIALMLGVSIGGIIYILITRHRES